MKKIIGIAAASALAIAAFGAPVAAGKDKGIEPGKPYCFGQVHKAVNAGVLIDEDGKGPKNVGQLVQSFESKGQGKNATAKTFCVVDEN